MFRRTSPWLAIGAAALVLSPQNTRGGTLTIGLPIDNCWCEQSLSVGEHSFGVWRTSLVEHECDLENVAFRITGLVQDPNLEISVVSRGAGGMTGDPFGDGAVVYDLIYAPGNTDVMLFRVNVTGPVPPQVWTIEAHLGIPGTTTPVAQFETSPGVWKPEIGYATRFGSATPDCDTCAALTLGWGCPFAVEPGTWSTVKRVYR